MDKRADDVITAIFEKAKDDARTELVADALRTAFERGRWTPEALDQVVEEVITASMTNDA